MRFTVLDMENITADRENLLVKLENAVVEIQQKIQDEEHNCNQNSRKSIEYTILCCKFDLAVTKRGIEVIRTTVPMVEAILSAFGDYKFRIFLDYAWNDPVWSGLIRINNEELSEILDIPNPFILHCWIDSVTDFSIFILDDGPHINPRFYDHPCGYISNATKEYMVKFDKFKEMFPRMTKAVDF